MVTTRRDRPGIERATGRNYDEWFARLDDWGAAGRPFREIARWLVDDESLSRWWAQKLIVEYEQARGVRPPGSRAGGTFTVGASKTVGVPVDRLFDAIVDPRRRERWLPGVELLERTSRPGTSARFDRVDDDTRISFTLGAGGDVKCVVAVVQERLPDARSAQRAKAFWRERLTALKAEVEGDRS